MRGQRHPRRLLAGRGTKRHRLHLERQPNRRSCVSPLMERILGIVVAVASGLLAAGATFWATSEGFLTAPPLIVCGYAVALSSGALAWAIATARLRLRVGLVATALLCVPALWAADALAWVDLGSLGGEDGPVRIAFSIAVVIAAVGLFTERVWARWLAFAGGALGMLSNGLNGIGTLHSPSLVTWGHALALACCGLLFAGVAGSSVRERFESAEHNDPLWRNPDPLVVGLRWTVLTSLGAAAMLLVYGLTQPIVPETQVPAIVLSLVIVVGSYLTVRRKIAGALLTTAGGMSLLVLTSANAVIADLDAVNTAMILAYYACFWVPAGVISTITGVTLARRMLGRHS